MASESSLDVRSSTENVSAPSTEADVGLGWETARVLFEREVLRFFRQRNRVFGAIGQPLIFWALFGAGLRSSFRAGPSDLAYDEYFFPGVVVLMALFTAIFATVSVIEDRREGFLQGVLVAPASRTMIVLGKTLGGTTIAVAQSIVFLLLTPIAGISVGPIEAVLAILHLIVLSFALTSVGMCLSWRMESIQGFHAIMSVFLMPMWLLSGAFFPAEGASPWLAWIMRLNPLTYGMMGFRRLLYLEEEMAWPGPSLVVSEIVTIVFAAVAFAIACRIALRRMPRT